MITVVNKYRSAYDMYIGRGSKWGNPFKSGTKEQNIADFEKYLLNSPELMQALPELLNKRIACFCKPKACHGDVLKHYAELT